MFYVYVIMVVFDCCLFVFCNVYGNCLVCIVIVIVALYPAIVVPRGGLTTTRGMLTTTRGCLLPPGDALLFRLSSL